jgi:hypothetical protein
LGYSAARLPIPSIYHLTFKRASPCPTPSVGKQIRVDTRVLNAFRHHWNPRSELPDHFVSAMSCSTPFGIIGILASMVNWVADES